jgi:hypothetical protein
LVIPPKSVSEVVAINVFGDPNIDVRESTRYTVGITDPEAINPASLSPAELDKYVALARMLASSHEMLEDEGRLTIIETLTPPSATWLSALLMRNRFHALNIVTGREASWMEQVDPYYSDAQRESEIPLRPAYMAIAGKF